MATGSGKTVVMAIVINWHVRTKIAKGTRSMADQNPYRRSTADTPFQ